MRKCLIIWLIANTVLFSCGQKSKSTPGTNTSKITGNVESQKSVTIPDDKYIDTRYEYAESTDKHLIIENSLPKGGQKYTAPNGKEYVYAIFWTRITNKTASPFELTLDFPADSLKLPSSPDNYVKILLPSDKMTLDKAPLFNYGLTGLDSLLDDGHHSSSILQRTINPNDSSTFYIVTLFNQGVEGVVRAGFKLKEQNLFYRINDKQIHCGRIIFQN